MRKVTAQLISHFRSLSYRVLRRVFEKVEDLMQKATSILPQTRTSHPVSKLLRPAFQYKKIKTVFGANLAGAVILAGSVSASPGSLDAAAIAETPVISEETVVITTERRFRKPVATVGLSQGFYRFHRGVDLRSGVGTPVYPIAPGRVREVVYGRFGYGHYVLVEHEGELVSLYAHLGNILVKPNMEISSSEPLGSVGMTGWTTGSHLHLEIYEKGVAVNPKLIVPLE